MKFYFIYEQAFPLGFGLTALLCGGVGLWGLANRRPLVFPFLVSFLCYLGVLLPLFLLSLNHFLEAWPLDWGTIFLNGLGVLGAPALLLFLWFSRFEITTVGAPASVVEECLREVHTGGASASRFLHFRNFPVCYLRAPSPRAAEWASEVRKRIEERAVERAVRGPLLCLFVGVVCAIVASISWCTAARCMVG